MSRCGWLTKYGAPVLSDEKPATTMFDPAEVLRGTFVHFFDVQPMSALVAMSMAQRRFSLVLMLVFAAVALLLAAVGIYGVMSYSVAQRTQEIGIRVALGATAGNVLRLVVKDGMRLVAAGLVLGLGGALAVTHLLTSLLYDVSATDALTYAVIALLLAAVAFVAIVIPARRAMRVDPIQSLRSE